MGLGATTRFAPLPKGARRVSVMRAGRAGLKALAPSPGLLAAFQTRKRALVREGMSAPAAHAEAARQIGYRERFRRQIRGSARSRAALRRVVAEAREGDLYLMCMCPYRTPGLACHRYLLLELAREVDPRLRLLPEPRPRRRRAPGGRRPGR